MNDLEELVGKVVGSFVIALIIVFLFKPLIIVALTIMNTSGMDPLTAVFVAVIFPMASTVIVIYKLISNSTSHGQNS